MARTNHRARRSNVRLSLERLEDRLNPSTTGVPWFDPLHMTLSFAPDGTQVNASADSNLTQALSQQIATGSWRNEILRAFQSWAASANVNIGVVSDGGQALGAAGLVQGDARFGDIRIAGTALNSSYLAIGTPFQPNGSTWSGDVVVNTNSTFTIGAQKKGYDLFSVVVHEAGHALGMSDNADPLSVMYGAYAGVRTGLGSQDVLDIQSLYGVRQSDAFDAKQANNTLATATSLSGSSLPITADVTGLNDVDYYKVTITDTSTLGSAVKFSVRTSGISLLVPSLTVYDAAGNAIGSSAATDPLAGNLSVAVNNVVAGSTYYIRVGNATQSVFGIGAYQLDVSAQTAGSNSNSGGSGFANLDNRNNDSLGTASNLTARSSTSLLASFSYLGSISDSADVDYYRIHSPTTATGSTQELIALVSATDVNGLVPRVDVYDAAGNPVAAQVIGNSAGFFSVQVQNALSNSDYYLRVAALAPSGSRNVGNYLVAANFNASATVALQSYASGTLTQANPQITQTLTANQSSAINFILSANAGGSTTAAQVQMMIYDKWGNLVFKLVANAGMPAATGVAYLSAGTYTVRYVAIAKSGAALPTITFNLKGVTITDPIGTTLVDSTTQPTTIDTTGMTTWGSSSYLPLATVYGYIEPFYILAP